MGERLESQDSETEPLLSWLRRAGVRTWTQKSRQGPFPAHGAGNLRKMPSHDGSSVAAK
jgi:hypothetical protein